MCLQGRVNSDLSGRRGNREQGTGNRKSRARNVTARIKHMFPRENDVRNSKSHVAAAPAPPYILIVKRTDGGPGAAATTRTISMCSRQQPFLFPVDCSLFPLHYTLRFHQHPDKSEFTRLYPRQTTAIDIPSTLQDNLSCTSATSTAVNAHTRCKQHQITYTSTSHRIYRSFPAPLSSLS